MLQLEKGLCMLFFVSGWLILAGALALLELCFQGLYLFLSFAIGCIPAYIAESLQLSYEIQGVLFIISSVVAFFILFYVIRKNGLKELVQDDPKHYKSAIDALPGKHGKVIEPIAGDTSWGLVKLKDGQEWSAQSSDGSVIAVKTEVVVIRVEGVRLIVTPYHKIRKENT